MTLILGVVVIAQILRLRCASLRMTLILGVVVIAQILRLRCASLRMTLPFGVVRHKKMPHGLAFALPCGTLFARLSLASLYLLLFI